MSLKHDAWCPCLLCLEARDNVREGALQAMHDLIVWTWCNATSGDELIEHWEGCAGADAVLRDLQEQLANARWAAGQVDPP